MQIGKKRLFVDSNLFFVCFEMRFFVGLFQINIVTSTNHAAFLQALFFIRAFQSAIDNVHFSSRLFVHLCGCGIFTMD